MKILVTGGTGFIGTHLVNALIGKYSGAEIEIVDDLSSSSLSPQRERFFSLNGISFKESTVANWEPSGRYDQIYHLACRVGPAHVTKYCGMMMDEIVLDAKRMANLAIENRSPLISVSTSEVYGCDPQGPQSEELSMTVPPVFTPRLEYTVGKLATEIQALNMALANPDLRVNFIRPFNIVGPYQTGEGGFVLPRFVEAALKGEPLKVHGAGTQIRAFTHVSDLVNALAMIMESDVNRKIYNIGTIRNTCTILDLAKKVVRTLNSSSKINHVNPQEIFGPLYTEAPSKIPDTSLIQRDLDWYPEWELDEIILDYADFLRQEESEAAAA